MPLLAHTRARVLTAAALVTTLGAMALPAAAPASDNQVSIMMDDDQLIYRGDGARDAALKKMKALGVDAVRVTMLWSVVADGARSTPALDERFRKLGADNPKAYPKGNWDRFDRLARACRTLGISLYLDVTGPGPTWGHEKPPASQRRNARTWKPKPAEFAKFVTAVGKRYSGRYIDENDNGQGIPRVSYWGLWNEPNQGGWLTPQWSGGKPASPAIFRKLFIAGRKALVQSGHGGDVILLGETAPLGSSKKTARSPMYPKTFIRGLFCVNAQDQAQRCSDFDKYGPLQATAFAHHPYTKKLPPTARDRSRDSITMANIAELPALLDDIAAKTGRVRAGLNVASTEFGYETNPPDPYSGVPLETQAQWNTIGEHLAYQQPRVIANTQFLLDDVKPLTRYKKGSKAYWFTYQSGLYFADGTPKPSATAYAFPFLGTVTGADANGNFLLNAWGQLRFRPNGLTTPDTVQVQWRPASDPAGWQNADQLQTVSNAMGFFDTTVTIPGAPGAVRAVLMANGAPVAISREQPVG
jgi:hypothetical protein